jgi:acyl-coenzyme A thioesterase PaaI-like protein
MSRISNLDYLRRLLSGILTPTDKSPFNFPFPIMKTLGFSLVEVGEGMASFEMKTKTEFHSNPMGSIHGGVLCDIADAAIGTAHFTTLTEGRASPVSIWRSISSDPFGTRRLKRSLNLFIEEER